MEASISTETSEVLDSYRIRNIEIGRTALELAADDDLQVIGRHEGGAESVVAARFLQKLEDATRQVHKVSEGCLSYRGVALFMLHKNRLLRDHMPLEILAGGEEFPVVEAGKCFYDPEFAAGLVTQEFDQSLDRAVTRLDRAYSHAVDSL